MSHIRTHTMGARSWSCACCGADRPPNRIVCRPCGGSVWISSRQGEPRAEPEDRAA